MNPFPPSCVRRRVSPREPRPALPGYLMFAAGVDLSLSLLLCLAIAAVIYRDQIYWQFASDPQPPATPQAHPAATL